MTLFEQLFTNTPEGELTNSRRIDFAEWVACNFRPDYPVSLHTITEQLHVINTALMSTGMDVSMTPNTVIPLLFSDPLQSETNVYPHTSPIQAQIVLRDLFPRRERQFDNVAHLIRYGLEHPQVDPHTNRLPYIAERVLPEEIHYPGEPFLFIYRITQTKQSEPELPPLFIVLREQKTVTGNTHLSISVSYDSSKHTGETNRIDILSYDVRYEPFGQGSTFASDILSWDVSDTVPITRNDQNIPSLTVSDQLMHRLSSQPYISKFHMLVPGRYLGGDVSQDEIRSFILRNADLHMMNLITFSAATIRRAMLYETYIRPATNHPHIPGALPQSAVQWFTDTYRDLADAADDVFTAPETLQRSIPLNRLDYDAYFYLLGHEQQFWTETAKFTSTLKECAEDNPAVFWKYLEQTGLANQLPVIRLLSSYQRNLLTERLSAWTKENRSAHGLAFFCSQLIHCAPHIQTRMNGSLDQFATYILHPLPDVYQYYNPNIPEGHNQSPEYYMTITLALAYYSLAVNWEPFGALVVKDGRMIGAHNELIEGKRYRHAEESALSHAEFAFGDSELSGCDMYTTEPCPRCAISAREHHLRTIYISTPTAMGGESVFGHILSTEALTIQDYYPPPRIVWNILEEKFIRLYRDITQWKQFLKQKP